MNYGAINRRKAFLRASAVLAVAALMLAGCGGGDATATLRGVVTMNGKPVTSGGIFFLKAGGSPLGGPIAADGTYEYSLPPGEYQVRIDAPAPIPANHRDGDPIPQLPRLVPEKFASFLSSGLTAVVTDESPAKVDFALP